MTTGRLGIWVSLVCFLALPAVAKERPAETCSQLEDDAETLYVYGDSDARFMLDQTCQSPTGESFLDKIIEKVECRCYDKKFAEVLAQLSKTGGPIQITSRKLPPSTTPMTCRAALEKCQTECNEIAKAAPKPCAEIRTAGIGFQ